MAWEYIFNHQVTGIYPRHLENTVGVWKPGDRATVPLGRPGAAESALGAL